MNKILFLLLGMQLNLIAMEPAEVPKDRKQKGPLELIERNALSSGLVAPSSSVPKVTSTSTVTSDRKSSPDSSSLDSDMAQLDLNKDGHLSKDNKRRSIIRLKAPAHSPDDEVREQLMLALQAYKENEAQKKRMADAREKQEKRKSIVFFAEPPVPPLNLSDMENAANTSGLTDDELSNMISFIQEATECDVTKIADRLKKRIKELHQSPPASPLFLSHESTIEALATVRKLTNQYTLGTNRVATLRNRPGTPDQLRPARPIEIIEDAGFKGLDLLYKMVMAEKDAKQQDTDTIKGRYKLSAIASVVLNVAAFSWGVYQQVKGNSSSTPTCPPMNTTLPM